MLMACFADELSAHQYLESVLWPNGPVCPRCGTRGRVGRLDGTSTRIGSYKCYACRKIFSITFGTIFSGSHVPLHKWLQAIFLTEGGATSIRPHHLERILHVSFKTAAGMLRKLEEAHASNLLPSRMASASWRAVPQAADEPHTPSVMSQPVN